MIQLFNEDCLEALKKLPDYSVDLVATDPPYCVGASSNGTKSSYTDLNMLKPFFTEMFKQCARVIKDGKSIYVCTDWRTYPILYAPFNKFFTQRNLIVWNHQRCGPGNWYRPDYEMIIFGTLGKSIREFSPADRDVWILKDRINQASKLHPSQKPIELFEKIIINSSKENDTVLDPFMGSGTTAIACMRLNRQFIGCELNEKYFETAKNRLARMEMKP